MKKLILLLVVLSLTSCKTTFRTKYRVNENGTNYYLDTLDIKNGQLNIREINRNGSVRVEKVVDLSNVVITEN